MKLEELGKGFHYAMHGNGAYKGLRQTNTRDAMMYWYQKGIHIFEIDMARTADAQYVAVAHYLNKKDLKRLEVFEVPEKPTLEWFMAQRLFSISTRGLMPLSLRTIVDLLKQHDDMVVMLDLFGLFACSKASDFAKNLLRCVDRNEHLLERILVESYNREMTTGLHNVSGRINVIACVRYEENANEKTIVSPQELLKFNVYFVSYPWQYTQRYPGEIEAYARSGITVFSRTKDNTQEMTLKRVGVRVNIVAKKYDGMRVVYQYPLYMMTYIKRIAVKLLIKLRMQQ